MQFLTRVGNPSETDFKELYNLANKVQGTVAHKEIILLIRILQYLKQAFIIVQDRSIFSEISNALSSPNDIPLLLKVFSSINNIILINVSPDTRQRLLSL